METIKAVKIRLRPIEIAIMVASANNEDFAEFLTLLSSKIAARYGTHSSYRDSLAVIRKELDLPTRFMLAELCGVDLEANLEVPSMASHEGVIEE